MIDITSPCSGLSAEDAAFCAAARNDVAEADVDVLLAEVALLRQRCMFILQEATLFCAAAEPWIGKDWAGTLVKEIERLKGLIPAARGEDMSDLNVLLTQLRGQRPAEKSEACAEYEALLRRLHVLIADGQGDSTAADAIRDDMEGPHRRLTNAERHAMTELSGQLYRASEARKGHA